MRFACILITSLALNSSCTNSSFNGSQTSPSPQEKKADESNAKKTENQSYQPKNPTTNPNTYTSNIDPQPTSPSNTNTVNETTTQTSQVETEPNYESVGTLKFKAVLFTNMEHQRHATDEGTYAILRDSSGTLVGSGKVTYHSASNGKNMGGMAYPVTELNIGLTKLNSNATSGNGKLSICKVKDTSSYECIKQTEDSERPVNWYDKEVAYKIQNNEIIINNEAGIIGNGPGVAGGLSFAHPVAFLAVGAKVQQYSDFSSPIILDLNKNNKIDLIDVKDRTNSVYFDHNGDGKKYRSGWVTKQDGLLALDINGDNQITSGLELFGEYSHIEKNRKSKTNKIKNFNNGFQALSQYDDNHDHRIDEKDSIYNLLKVWIDLDSNGIGEANELVSLKKLKIKSISLKFKKNLNEKNKSYVVSNGNEIRLTGKYTDTSGKKHSLADVWFKADYQKSLGLK